MNKFSKRSLQSLNGVHPDMVRLMELAIVDCPVDFTITEGVRTVARQRELYAQGRTTPGKIVTYVDGITSKSKHQVRPDGYGYAVDLYPYVNGSVKVNDIANLGRIAEHIKSVAKANGISVVWGGDWKMKDYPHFELR